MRGGGPTDWVRLKGLSKSERRWACKQLLMAIGTIVAGGALLYFMFTAQGPTPLHP